MVAPRLALAHEVDHVVDRRLHRLRGERRHERDLLGHLARRGAERGARHDAVHEPVPLGFVGARTSPRRTGTPSPCAARAPTARRATRRRRPTCAAPGSRSGRRRPRRSGRTCTRASDPAAEHVPCTAAIVGLRKSRIFTSLSKYMTCSWRSLPSGVSRIAAQCSSPASSSFRSWPAEKCLPSAASTTTRTVVVGVGAVERGVELVDQRGCSARWRPRAG